MLSNGKLHALAEQALAKRRSSSQSPSAAVRQATPTGAPSPLQRVVQETRVASGDTLVGGAILEALAPQATASPPPTQKSVEAYLGARCPLLMLKGPVHIYAPGCGPHPSPPEAELGSWASPRGSTGEELLLARWHASGGASGELSLVPEDGDGSEILKVRHQAALSGDLRFEVVNCQGAAVWLISQQQMEVGKKHFVQFTIERLNGTAVAKTGYLRPNVSEVNVTTAESRKDVIARARRHGHWQGAEWRKHHNNLVLRWELEFPKEVRQHDLSGSAEDLRLIAAAAITLMAVLDEEGAATGASFTLGDAVRLVLPEAVLFLLALVAISCLLAFHQTELGNRLRWFCLRLQLTLLPKQAAPHPRHVEVYGTW